MDRGYFVDYEVWSEGLPVSWGNIALSCPQLDDAFDPSHLLAFIRARAARERLATPQEIRIRNVVRL